MRTIHSIKNLITGLGLSLIMILMGFITRRIFIDNIGIEYLGLNGLLQNILGAMTILESGFAGSVVYNMYKPLAENNQPEIIALLQLYKKVYRYIALGIFICAIALLPFIDHFIEGSNDLSYVTIVYVIYLFNSLVNYFTAYKWSIINASQQNYKLAKINLIYQLGLNISKILILSLTQDYILYLIIEFIYGIGLNIAIVRKANKLFPYIVTSKKYDVPADVKKNITTNMKALFLHGIGGYFMHSTDNIIISSYLGLGTVGLLSNYTLITSTIKGFASQVLCSYSESVGNLIATESNEKIYKIFQTLFFVNYITISIPVIILFNTITPFVKWWLGDSYILPNCILGIILFNFYIDNMRSSALTFKTKSGIFVQDRFSPFLQGCINLIFSLLLVKHIGLAGVLLATGISILSIGFWQFPKLIYKYTFRKPVMTYFRLYIKYTLIALIALITSYALCSFCSINNCLLKMITNCTISIVVTIIIYTIFYHKTPVVTDILFRLKFITNKLYDNSAHTDTDSLP